MKIKFKKYWRTSSFKNEKDGDFLLKHIEKAKPKNFLEIGVFHGVTSRNVCEVLYLLHGNDFKFTGIDLFLNDNDRKILKDEYHSTSTISCFISFSLLVLLKLYNSFTVGYYSVKQDKMMSAYMSEFVSFNILDKDYI